MTKKEVFLLALNPTNSRLKCAFLHPAPARGDCCPQGISWKEQNNFKNKTLNPALNSIWKTGHALIILRRSPEVTEVVGLTQGLKIQAGFR